MQKTVDTLFFSLRVKKNLVGSESTRVEGRSASYLLRVKSKLGSGQCPSLTTTQLQTTNSLNYKLWTHCWWTCTVCELVRLANFIRQTCGWQTCIGRKIMVLSATPPTHLKKWKQLLSCWLLDLQLIIAVCPVTWEYIFFIQCKRKLLWVIGWMSSQINLSWFNYSSALQY